jgi:hypothetical protein
VLKEQLTVRALAKLGARPNMIDLPQKRARLIAAFLFWFSTSSFEAVRRLLWTAVALPPPRLRTRHLASQRGTLDGSHERPLAYGTS